MKQYILVCFVCVLGIITAGNITNTTNNDLPVNGDGEGFYTVDVLLVADVASTPKIG
jgi:hypothetical protein